MSFFQFFGGKNRNQFVIDFLYGKRAFTVLGIVMFMLIGKSFSSFGQTLLVDSAGDGGFENGTTFSANGWTVVSDDTNYWTVGTTTFNSGSRSAYVSTNGTNNSYDINTDNTSHFYRDITVPAGEDNIILSFYLKGIGEAGYDRLLIYTAPTSITPTAGTPVQWDTDFPGATLIYEQSETITDYALITIVLDPSFAGTTFRLIFTWQNDDNTGSQPPDAIDDISVRTDIYCSSYGNTSRETSITLVDFNTINNVTAKPAVYNDYTAQSTNVVIGNSYNLTVNLNTDGWRTCYARAWIDWNHDGDFTDSGEEYDLGDARNVTDGATSNSPLSITIPTGATLGSTRMRVSTKRNNYPTSCETDFNGEVEDYTVNICKIPDVPTLSLSASQICSGDDVTLNISGNLNSATQWVIYTGSCGGTQVGTTTSSTYTLTNVTSSETYYVRGEGSCIASGSCGSASVYVKKIIPLIAETNTVQCSNSTDGTIDLSVPFPIQFNGSDYIDINSTLLSNKSAFTLEGWIKTDDFSSMPNRTSLFGQNDAIEFFFNGSTLMCWTASGGSVSTGTYPSDNLWHHVAAVGNGTDIRLYIDGVLVATGGHSASNYGSNTTYSAKIGAGVVDASGGTFPGQILKVGFYSIALTATDISSLAGEYYQYTGSETGLLAGYNFYEGTGTTLGSEVSSTDGTFSSSPTWVNNYTYSWTKTGDAGFSETTQDLTNVTPGTYNVTVTNSSLGCDNTGSWTINFNDTQDPVTPTLTDVTAECSVTPPTPTTTDNCAGTISGTTSTTFPIITQGTTVVTWTFDDGNGNSIDVDQNVIINDVTDPVNTSCPGNITVDAAVGSCDAVVTYSAPEFSDNCDGTGLSGTLTSGLASGSAFPVGTTTVTYEYTDNAGNGPAICSFTVTVNSTTAADVSIVVDNNPICSGSSATFTATPTNGGSSPTYQWKINGTNAGTNSATFTTSLLNNGDIVTVEMTSSIGCATGNPATSNSITISIDPTSVGGTATAANSTICNGSNTTITLSGYTGSIQWQQSADGTSGWADVTGGSGATTDNYTTANLTATTYYRAEVTSGVCSATFSDTVTIDIYGTTITSGAVGGAPVVEECEGGNPGQFSVGAPSGGDGNYTYQWKESVDCSGNWVNATAEDGNTTSLTFNPPVLTDTICYRLKITDGCGSTGYSGTKTYNIVPDPVSQDIDETPADGSVICIGDNVSATFSGGSGGTGTVTDVYEYSTDNGSNWSSYTPGTDITATAGMVGTDRIQIRTRRTATGSGCNYGTWNYVKWTVAPDNTITLSSAAGTDDQTVCLNTAITDITYATTGATGATFNGLPSGVGGSWAADVVTISGSPSAFGTFNYTVTLTGGCGNVTANGTITVEDTENPTITCPANVTVNPDAGLCTASGVALGSPAVNDNCHIASVTNNASEPYSMGNTTVTWTVTDDAGNFATCDQTVTVQPAAIIDIRVEDLGNTCQSGETGSTTTITWDITKVVGSTNWTYDYTINDGTTDVQTGTNVSVSGNIQISYTLNNTTGTDKTYTITLTNVKDNCGVAETNTGNNSDAATLYGLPDTGEIIPD